MCVGGCVNPGLAPAVGESLFPKTMRSAERVTDPVPLSRRAAIGVVAASAAAVVLRPLSALATRATPAAPVTKPIPSSGEKIPVVGLGSWITFNVGDDPELRDECAAVMQAFFHEGGRLIDSSQCTARPRRSSATASPSSAGPR